MHDSTTAQDIYSSKIQHHPLSLLPTSVPSSVLDARAKRRLLRASKRAHQKKARPLTARQKRALGIYDLVPSGRGRDRGKDRGAWVRYAPLRKLWLGYVREILGVGRDKTWVGVEEAGAMLVGADFHGAVVRVVRSRCVGRVGIEGMVLREARGVLLVVSQLGEFKMVPKEGTVFEVKVDLDNDQGQVRDLLFEIHGDGIICRPAERAGKKFKLRMNVDL